MFLPKNQIKRNRLLAATLLCAAALVPASLMRSQSNVPSTDILYVGDTADNTIKRFNAGTGSFLDSQAGAFVLPGSGGLRGPRGIIIDPFLGNNLIVVNQNVDLNFAGEILEYSAADGQFIAPIVPCNKPTGRTCDSNAPFAPRGIVRSSDGRFVVANIGKKEIGSVAQFDETGAFLGNLDFADFTGDSFGEYHPRGVVFGADGKLYVSVVGNLDPNDPHFNPLAGFILRFQNGTFLDVFASDSTCPALHRPEGLVFGPDGKLYVTSFRADTNDTDKVLIFKGAGTCSGKIDLDTVGGVRTYAQALLFGPGGRLFVPISNTGEVRSYDVQSKHFQSFVNAFGGPSGGPLQAPYYLTFGNTDPGTLQYGR
ncbi:MAG TPA: hypothetical protein VLJ11_10880 [Bryobacteraceae bacterium]|nr:hypothetical protein [Bryobacteraceae bacterium]